MKNKNQLLIFLIITSVLSFSMSSFAEVTVTSVKGQAKYKTGNQWLNLAQGIKLAEGTKISTGANSSVVLNINGDTVTIRQMSMIKIEENSISNVESNTRIGLKRGGLNARISKLKTLRTNFRISTPVATSSVRGTEEEVSYGPGMGMIVKVIDGEILALNRFGLSNRLRGKLEYKQENHKSTPDDVNSSRREGSRGGLINNLTLDEKNYMEFSSDLFITPDQRTTPTPQYYGGTGNVTVTPVFP